MTEKNWIPKLVTSAALLAIMYFSSGQFNFRVNNPTSEGQSEIELSLTKDEKPKAEIPRPSLKKEIELSYAIDDNKPSYYAKKDSTKRSSYDTIKIRDVVGSGEPKVKLEFSDIMYVHTTRSALEKFRDYYQNFKMQGGDFGAYAQYYLFFLGDRNDDGVTDMDEVTRMCEKYLNPSTPWGRLSLPYKGSAPNPSGEQIKFISKKLGNRERSLWNVLVDTNEDGKHSEEEINEAYWKIKRVRQNGKTY